MTGKKQAVPAVPADLSEAIESLHEQGTLTWSERKPWMILGGCKEKRKRDGNFVRPSNSFALWETERVLVERLRLQLQVDPECRAAFHGPDMSATGASRLLARISDRSICLHNGMGNMYCGDWPIGRWSRVRGFAMRLALVGWDSFAGNLGDSL